MIFIHSFVKIVLAYSLIMVLRNFAFMIFQFQANTADKKKDYGYKKRY